RPRIVSKLDAMAAREDQLMAQAVDPVVLASPDRARNLQRELGLLQRVTVPYAEYRKLLAEREDEGAMRERGGDPELAELAREELPEQERRISELAEQILDKLLSEASQGERNAIVEIRAGTGGEEAALWARDLFDMYSRYCD